MPLTFIRLEYDTTSNSNYNTSCWYKVVSPADGKSYAITNSSAAYQNIALFEISGADAIYTYNGVGTGSGTTTLTTGSLVAETDSNGLNLLLLGWNSSTTATNPGGFTLLSPGGWQGSGFCSPIWSIPYNTSGTQSVSMSGSSSNPIWLNVQLVTTVTQTAYVGQVAQEILGTTSAVGTNVGQVAQEILGSSATHSVMYMGQVVREILLTSTPPTHVFLSSGMI